MDGWLHASSPPFILLCGGECHGSPLNLFLGVVQIDEKKRVDWNAIRAEYISGGISQRQLAKKHGVSFNTLKYKAQAEGWESRRQETYHNITTSLPQKVAEATIDTAIDNATASERCRAKVYHLFELCAENMERSGHITAQSVRHLSAALKDLQADEPKQVDVEDLSPLVELLKL